MNTDEFDVQIDFMELGIVKNPRPDDGWKDLPHEIGVNPGGEVVVVSYDDTAVDGTFTNFTDIHGDPDQPEKITQTFASIDMDDGKSIDVSISKIIRLDGVITALL